MGCGSYLHAASSYGIKEAVSIFGTNDPNKCHKYYTKMGTDVLSRWGQMFFINLLFFHTQPCELEALY